MRLMAPTFFGSTQRPVQIYMVLLHVLVTFMFPVHLLINLALQPTSAELFQNLSISMTCAACSLKHVAHIYHLQDSVEIERLLIELDGYVDGEEEHRYYADHLQCHARRFTRCLYASFAIIYALFLLSILILIASADRQLLYPAYFPFDWRANGYLFAMALGYQSISILLEGAQALANDSYAPLTLCFLGGHIHMWGLRMQKLGYAANPIGVNHHQQLCAYIEQHKTLMRVVQLLRSTMHLSQFGQFIASGISISITLVYILFFAENNFDVAYYGVYFAAILLELFPCCYYGTLISVELNRLTDAIFSSNWVGMDRGYCRTLLIFMQLTLAKVELKAGGMIGISLNAFFATIRLAYSFFTLAMSLRK
ncbi:odorant receptor 33c [Drosophila obscura]|uniref:odorant receptor 33c n=1 Tax=Drosophila obscura TaxID=7282 RepID=UPI001BB277A5|nr:odorant receptor 33c [Drosophila obscura]